jgi:hypothetical protein
MIGSSLVHFIFVSSFFETADLTGEADPITVTKATLAGQQVNNIYTVNVNETFDISVMPIDSITRLQLGKIQWGSWTWTASVALHSLLKFNPQDAFFDTSSSETIVDLSASTVTISNLTINVTGMYVLDILLISTNNEHVITLTSNGILVKNDDGKLEGGVQS